MNQETEKECRWKWVGSSGKIYLDINPVVFISTVLLIILFLLAALIYLHEFSQLVDELQNQIANQTGWFFVLAVNIILFYLIYLVFTPIAGIRLGGDSARPEFSYAGWFAMLFSAGMGIGLMFYSVAEPVYHLMKPPHGASPYTLAAYKDAISTTYLHWGFHAWGIYALTGLAIAYFAYNKKQVMSIRSLFYPLFGNHVNGIAGHTIDIIAAVATLFGVATSLGLGVIQINAGLHALFEIDMERNTQLLLITLITLIATASVVLGIKRGIKRLSIFNISVAFIFLNYVFWVGPTLFNLNAFVENIGLYLNSFFLRSFWNETYTEGQWQNAWTVFYWGWWFAWSPFVGMFIARVSYGRTIKEFIIAVLLFSSLATFVWLSVFGSSALYIEMHNQGVIANAIQENIASSLFVFLEYIPLAGENLSIPKEIILFMGGLATIVIVSFFVTSSDSGSLVIDILTAGGKISPPVLQRIFWALTEGVVAATLLILGGLKALQTAAISFGILIACLQLLIIVSLHRSFLLNNKQN